MTKRFCGYIRVSTAKQGEKGVSLQEQRDAIERYASRNGLEVAQWFEERETAAKHGRPVFGEMLKLLRMGKVSGVVIHKIDRSARNMKDWAEIGELIDGGIDVRFANEGLDLNTRGGRLSADIQAVVAADFIRNLREETRKGFYGRLKQGLYPMPAPLGYVDQGKGNPKAIDPVKGPLVRRAFELYGSGKHSLETLAAELHRMGLRNRQGGRVSLNGLSIILNNPFYIGLIRVQATGETFAGAHEPLIPTSLFNCVHRVLTGKTNARPVKHEFLFRRLVTCARCGYSLIGEMQKGHVYYRCHTQSCPTTGVREDRVDDAVVRVLAPLTFTERERRYLAVKLARLREDWKDDRETRRQNLNLRVTRLAELLGRLTDAFLDGTIERELFEERKTALLMERQTVKDELEREPQQSVPEALSGFLELAGSAFVSYKVGLPEERRELLEVVTSNRQLDGKTPSISLSRPFAEVANRLRDSDGSPFRGTPRTWDALLAGMSEWLSQNKEVAEKILSARHKKDNKPTISRKGWRFAA